MKLIIKLFFIIIFFFVSLSSDIVEETLENILDKNDTEDTKIYFKYEKDEENKHIYKNQVFKVNLSLLVFDDDNFVIKSKLSNSVGLKILDDNLSWEYQGDNQWKSFLFLKATSNNVKLPDINISTISDNTINQQTIMQGYNQHTKQLNWMRDSSQVLANSLEVLDYTSKIYNKNSNIVFITIKAEYANLEDINISNKNIINQGIQDLEFSYPESKLIYYAIIPNYINIFTFNYFNLENKKFQDIKIEINTHNDNNFLIADIDPESKLYEKYKLLFLMLVIFLTLFLSFYRKKLSYLLITIFLIIVLVSQFFISEKGVIEKGAKFRVFPIENSTIFFVSTKKENVKILNRNEDFVKIDFNNKIGWVNEKYVIKN